ncbi:hypothetical protein [Acinetobacter haemolyticus]|uniref:hypothetical protein n=1 Tax=Acinetobacter haemolyticus TaxID=29430 RepID=UPI003AF8346D
MGKSKEQEHLEQLHWLQTLGEADLAWVTNSIDDIKTKISAIKEEAAKNGVHPHTFYNLEKFLQMFQFVMNDRHQSWESEKEETEQKLNAFSKEDDRDGDSK